jgi:hypothetical protein
MRIDPTLRIHIEAAFAPLNTVAAATAFPETGALSKKLNAAVPAASAGAPTRNLPPREAALFATAAVDAWLRAVHSFLISCSLTSVSPIWASVVGYYSSHYSVRALAHLLGYFQLFVKKRIVRIELVSGHFVCTFETKKAGDREHQVYWRIVKHDQHFRADPFFNENDSSVDESDGGHRNRANYIDHLPQFPMFRPLDEAALRHRIDRISEIEISAPPIPRVSKYPDIESVQIVAYHRLVRFRDLVNTILGDQNRFWRVHRNPAWAATFMDFQLTEQATVNASFTLS